jgi:protein phosphatase
MSDDRAPESPGATTDRRPAGATLASGHRIGPYIVTAVAASAATESVYWAQDGAEEYASSTSGDRKRMYQIHERARGAYDYARPVVALGLAHAHLLAPVAVLTQSDRDFLVTQALNDDAHGEGARLSAAGALAAGVALADALTYLHGGGVAHLRISPALIVLHDRGAHLTGLEDAQLIHPLDPNAGALFARDAAFLAHSLGALAGISEADTTGEHLRPALAAIVARAAAGVYATASQVGADCAAALQAQPAALATAPTEAPKPQPAAANHMRLALIAASSNSVGMVRAENQDASAIVQFDLRDDASQSGGTNPGALYLVADGMGGEERGELASRIATRVVVAEVWRELALPLLHTPVEAAETGAAHARIEMPSLTEVLSRAGQTANARIRTLAVHLGKTTGTTLTALLVVGERAALVHVGDSRAYRLRDGAFEQLTQDHTLLARMKAAEHPLLEDPLFAMPRNFLYRSLGQADEVEIDVSEVTLAAGDRLLLCSDGLWDEVDDARIAAILGGAAEPRAGARALVAAADAAGGKDNSTAVVLFVESVT